MEKFAVIDVGSNSVRLMVVADGKVLYKALETTQLGEGIAERPFLRETPMSRTASAISSFVEKARTEGAEAVYGFATAAVRSAENRAVFLEKVRSLCGLSLEVLSGETEAEIGLLGALGNADGGIVDIGGASTEIVLRKNGATVYEKSVDIGVVRLKDSCGRELFKLEEKAKQAVLAYGEVPKADKMYAIGGTATTLASLALGLEEYDGGKVTGFVLSGEILRALVQRLSVTSVDELTQLPCIPRKRAEVLLGGAVWLRELAEAFSFTELIVSDRDNLEGYAVWKGLL